MNNPNIADVKEKERRVKEYLEKSGNDAVIIGRQDNFAWYTCGGNNRVLITSETGFTILVITKQKTYAIAHTMDGPRVFDEELKGLGMEPVFLRWYEESREEKASFLVKGMKCIADIHVAGSVYSPDEIFKLHYPLTEKEMEKCRENGRKTDEILAKVAGEIEQGMSEHEVEGMFMYEYGRNNMAPIVLLIGSDDRISKYRHPCPSDKKIERFVLLHPAVRRWGLHANVTRLLYFGDRVPEDIMKRYDAACRVQATAISMCVPGTKFSDILKTQKRVYKETGFEEEWRNHFQGGITGYIGGNPVLCNDPEAEISLNQPYDWYITITGVKSEELSLNSSRGIEVPSMSGKWPVQKYEYNGKTIELPKIMLR